MKRSSSVNVLDELKKKEEEEYNKYRKGEVFKQYVLIYFVLGLEIY